MSLRIDRRVLDATFLTLLAVTGWRLATVPPPSLARLAASADVPEIHTLPADRSGSGAHAPSAIPALGWWDIAKRTFDGISNDRILTESAGVTFYALLALFPAMTALVSLYGMIADPQTISDSLVPLAGVVPEGGLQILSDQLHALTTTGQKTLGFGAVIGFATALWSANAGIKALFDALNTVYEEKEKRSFVFRTLLSMCFTISGLFFIILVLSALVVLPTLEGYGRFGSGLTMLLKYGRWPLLLVVITVGLAVVYRYGPSRAAARWRWVTWGGAFASIMWLVTAVAFSYYTAKFGNYNKTYGSLGAAVGFMTWIWLSTTVVLIGGEVNAQIERQAGAEPALRAR